MDDYLCVYILIDDYFYYMFKEHKKNFICIFVYMIPFYS